MKVKNGFTLLELLVVMAILGLLATLIVPKFSNRTKQAKRLQALLQIKNLSEALEHYYVDQGNYPSTQVGLKALLEKNKMGDSYLQSDSIPKDPWGNPYYYLSPGLDGRSYDIVSFSEGHERGGQAWAKDIQSWNLDDEKIF